MSVPPTARRRLACTTILTVTAKLPACGGGCSSCASVCTADQMLPTQCTRLIAPLHALAGQIRGDSVDEARRDGLGR